MSSSKYSPGTPLRPLHDTQMTVVFSHASTVVLCGKCNAVLAQPAGGKVCLFVLARSSIHTLTFTLTLKQARITAGSSFRVKPE